MQQIKYYMYDIESYKNYMCVGFMSDTGNRIKLFESFDKPFSKLQIQRIKRLKKRVQLVGFNSLGFDDPILTLMLQGDNTLQVNKVVQEIITNGYKKWEVYGKLHITKDFESIDLIDVAPGAASLKLYMARLNSDKLQDLPYDPTKILTEHEGNEVGKYNINDLQGTLELFNKLQPQLKLRENIGKKYDIEVMSKSDAQIAESIFKIELTKLGVNVKKGSSLGYVKYKAPEVVGFIRDDLNDIVDKLEADRIELSGAGQPMLPKWLKDTKITIGSSVYNIGLGGLHSTEKSLVVIPKDDEVLRNIDVASYYPSLIINLKLFPTQLTEQFLKVYAGIKSTRLQAKKDGKDMSLTQQERDDAKVTDAVLKITLNGSYGKFGSKYSFLYSPDLLLNVTFTGQLYLLMLIEELEHNGFKVVSSNTDGVEILMPKDNYADKLLKDIVSTWERDTGMVMEYGKYNALFARDVNNYIAVYEDKDGNPYSKAKGVYADPEDANPILNKNIEYPIVFEAIREYLANGVPMEDTLYNCEDVARFTISRNVTGGCVFYEGKALPNTPEYNNYISNQLKSNKALEKRNDNHHKELILKSTETRYLGKVVRFYYADGGSTIFKTNGNKVSKSDGSKPMMDLTESIPKDLDYDKYIELCYEHLSDLGVKV